ncbi:pilus (MSHA type) biogenesis protein MshL [Pseudomonadota bacterium]
MMFTHLTRQPISGTLMPSVAMGMAMLLLTACGASNPPKMSPRHLDMTEASAETSDIPLPVFGAPTLPPPKLQPKQETYTVVVNSVPAGELLFSLARDAKLNVDIHPSIDGTVTLNAIDQTLPQILDRIAKQVSLRYQLDGATLVLEPDSPYWQNYRVDYVNMARDTTSEVGVATEISTAGGSVGEEGGSTDRGNISNTTVKNSSSNHFWEVLEKNILSLLNLSAEEAEGSSPVVSNPVSGMIAVYANHMQQRNVQAFIDLAVSSALRQVLIEMTIVEVDLSDRYQAGVDWQHLVGAGRDGLTALSTMSGANLSTAPVFSLNYQNTTATGRSFSGTIKMLETFGDVKVLSSPKIMALNNQTALLKVVDEKVYFTVDRETEEGTDGEGDTVTFTTQVHTVPVGLVMSVTPQINDVDSITLNIRPTISRITGYAVDPGPRLIAGANFDNLIPEIQVREMESLLQVANGQMVVMGGLMQNKVNKNSQGVPLLSSLPWIGSLFKYKSDEYTKSELVIFLQPTVVKGAAVGTNLQAYSDLLIEHDGESSKDVQ